MNSNPGADIDFLLIPTATLFLSFHLCNKVNRTHQSPRMAFASAQHLQGAKASFLRDCGAHNMGVTLRNKIMNAQKQLVQKDI